MFARTYTRATQGVRTLPVSLSISLLLLQRLHPRVLMLNENANILLFGQVGPVDFDFLLPDENIPKLQEQEHLCAHAAEKDPHHENLSSRPTSPSSLSCKQQRRATSLNPRNLLSRTLTALSRTPLEVEGRGGKEARPWSPAICGMASNSKSSASLKKIDVFGGKQSPRWPSKMRCEISPPYPVAASRRSTLSTVEISNPSPKRGFGSRAEQVCKDIQETTDTNPDTNCQATLDSEHSAKGAKTNIGLVYLPSIMLRHPQKCHFMEC